MKPDRINRGKVFTLAGLVAVALGAIAFQCSGDPDDAVARPTGAQAAAPNNAPRAFLPAATSPPGATAPAALPGASLDTVDEAACTACEQQHIKSGDCEPDSGCDGLDTTDRALCESLLACQRRTNCWAKDPLDCLCGTAPGVECAQGAADGACRAEIQAATKTTDPIKNGTLFFDPSVPAGRANRLIACASDHCKSVCAPKSSLR